MPIAVLPSRRVIAVASWKPQRTKATSLTLVCALISRSPTSSGVATGASARTSSCCVAFSSAPDGAVTAALPMAAVRSARLMPRPASAI